MPSTRRSKVGVGKKSKVAQGQTGIPKEAIKIVKAMNRKGATGTQNVKENLDKMPKKRKATVKKQLILEEKAKGPKKQKQDPPVCPGELPIEEVADPVFDGWVTVWARVLEDDNYVDMVTTDDMEEFPMDAEGLTSQSSSDEETECEEGETSTANIPRSQSRNNNAMRLEPEDEDHTKSEDGEIVEEAACNLSQKRKSLKEKQIPFKKDKPSLEQAFFLMQDYMLHKGLIDSDSLTEENLNAFLEGAADWHDQEAELTRNHHLKVKSSKKSTGIKDSDQLTSKPQSGPKVPTKGGKEVSSILSETTVYRRAVPNVDDRTSNESTRDISSSSDDLIDTSDELINKGVEPESFGLTEHFITGCAVDARRREVAPEPGTSQSQKE